MSNHFTHNSLDLVALKLLIAIVWRALRHSRMTRPDRLAAQLKTASTSQSEEIKEISNLLKSLNKTLNELSKKHTEAGRTLEELHRKNEEVRTTLGEIKQDNADVLKHLTP